MSEKPPEKYEIHIRQPTHGRSFCGYSTRWDAVTRTEFVEISQPELATCAHCHKLFAGWKQKVMRFRDLNAERKREREVNASLSTRQQVKKRTEKIIEMARAGSTREEIAHSLGVGRAAIYTALRGTEIRLRGQKPRSQRAPSSRDKEVVRLRESGLSLREIATRVGLSISGVQYVLNKMAAYDELAK